MATPELSLPSPVEQRMRTVSIAGIGSYLPERVLTNQDLEKMVDTTDEWIQTRTGIQERHLAREDETTSDMAAEAARRALAHAGVAADEVDVIIVATITPDMVFPNTACFVQEKIGASKAFCFGLEAACSGFLYSLDVGKQFVATGAAETVLVIGAEKLSSITDWEDRATCVLFGDGAGAAVLQARGDRYGIANTVMGSDGALAELLHVPAGGSRAPATVQSVEARLHYLKMAGSEVFKNAVRAMSDSARRVLEQAGLTIDDVDLLVPHQANRRIIEAIGSRLGIDSEKVFMNLDRTGNTSAASVPLALDEAVQTGRLERGQLVLIIVFGGGFTWGAGLVEW